MDRSPYASSNAPAAPLTRAALMLWAVGAAQTLLAGCLLTGVAAALTADDSTLRDQGFTTQQMQQVEMIRSMRWLVLATMLGLGLLPGVAYLALGLGVRRGWRGAIGLAQLIALTQIIILGVLALGGVLAAVSRGSPGELTQTVLLLGTPLAVLVFLMRWLSEARTYQIEVVGQETDPWNEPDG